MDIRVQQLLLMIDEYTSEDHIIRHSNVYKSLNNELTELLKPKVYDLGQATDWFLKNSSGSVVCYSKSAREECFTYPQALSFYENNK